VHDSIAAENAVKMYQTVHAYGAYPIDVQRVRARRKELRDKGELKLRTGLDI
jgi:hypothetical protein